MKVALAQVNPIVGDIPGNVERIAAAVDRAAAEGAELVVFSELSICGYPPRDLLLKPQFVDDCIQAVHELASHCTRTAALVGFVQPSEHRPGRALHNAAALLAEGQWKATHVKTLLPTYDVFDETRYFEPGPPPAPVPLDGRCIGVTICEDLWDPGALGRQLYRQDPISALVDLNAQLLVNLSASPYQLDKHRTRMDLLSRQARRVGKPIIYVNQVGGNDELIFDGASCVFDAEGRLIGQCKPFEEDMVVVDVHAGDPLVADRTPVGMAGLKAALELGLKDYVRKCGFCEVVLGLSGGIDSAVVATLAVDALGADRVHCVALPSRYSSDHSLTDAAALAANLGVDYRVIPIEPMHSAFEAQLAPHFHGTTPGTAEENIQARVRGIIVMSLSNKFGWMPVATGNKSEFAVGYCTLYGDMAGGMSVIGDVPKTVVFELARHINQAAGAERIPHNIIRKAPSAELKPDQTDQDSLPSYDTLDGILECYVEREMSIHQIVAEGFGRETVARVIGMVDRNEYKRRQAAPGLKVTGRAFGMGRRMPIAQRFRYH